MAQLVKNLPAMRETWVRSLDWGDSPREGKGYPLQYSCLGNPMGRGAWQATVHGVAKESDTTLRLNNKLVNINKNFGSKTMTIYLLKVIDRENSLVVQWVRLHSPHTGGPGSMCGLETVSHMQQRETCKDAVPQLGFSPSC